MNKILFPWILAAFVTAGTLSAQTLVDYVDGSVDLKAKSGAWQPLVEGTKLPGDAVFRVKDGAVELSQGTTKWHIGKDGTYQVSALLNRNPPAGSQDVADVLGNKVSKLFGVGPQPKVQTTNAGVRATEQPGATLEWAEDEPDAESIDALVQKGDWPRALAAVSSALASHPDNAQGLLFTKARILANQGRAAGALKALNDAKVGPTDPHFLEASLIYATQGVEAQQFDVVLTKTAEALPTVEDTEVVQVLTLAQALAYQGQGDAAQARAKLQAVVKLGTETAAGAEARKLLGN
jgi:tetratricopeptide (TPR) repeat protein